MKLNKLLAGFFSIALLISNYPYPTNITSIQDFFGWGNSVTANLFGLGLLFTIWIIAMVGMFTATGDIGKALLGSSAFAMFVTLALIGMSLVSGFWLIPEMSVAAIGFILVRASKGESTYS